MPTDECAADINALVREARVWHRARDAGWVGGQFEQYARCLSCVARWPCLTARMADALAASQQDALEQLRHLVDATDERNAARAEAAALRERAEKVSNRLAAMAFAYHHVDHKHKGKLSKCQDAACSANVEAIAPQEPRHE